MSFFAFVFCLWFDDVIGAEVRIKTVNEFANFKNNVNKGTTYEGTTVFLDSDIDFTGKIFEPIGKDWYNYFLGVFDGQGHVISNLKMSTSSQYVGLFGYSGGLTIKNVILDSSCSITSSYSSDSAHVGGIIGYCYTSNGPCTFENNVNIGSVTFSGNIRYSLWLGGIAGDLDSDDYDSTVKNCANYGDVTYAGTSYYSYIGGIVGESYGYSSDRVYIYNCINYGTISYKGTTSNNLNLGGIVGRTLYTTIENCVSGGKISSKKSSNIGSIVGYVYSSTSINNCYYTSELSGYTRHSGSFSYDSTAFQLSETVSIGSYTGNSLIDALNSASDYYTLRDYSLWLLNKNNKDVTFTINIGTSFVLNSQIILLPSLAREGNMSFDVW